MAKDPAVLFYTSDFISGTVTMTDEQRGRYIMLLCIQHQKGYLTEKDMMSICKEYDEDIWCKFYSEDGKYYNERMKNESERRKRYTESRRQNRNKGDNENVCVYLMIDHMTNHIKIGSSNKPERRLQEIRVQHDNEKIDLIAYTKPTSQTLESQLQKHYKDRNVGLEWFKLSNSEVKEIIIENDMIYHMNTHMETETTTETIINKDGKHQRFTPPTVDQVNNFCSDTGKQIDAERFVNFYQSKGWMVGKNKMKDWKAAVNNWAREGKEKKGFIEEPGANIKPLDR